VIPRILVKESLNLELWLKSYEGLKFQWLFCKFHEKNKKIGFSGIIFGWKNPWTRLTGLWTAPAQSTMDQQPLPLARAHRSSASGRSNGRGCRTRGGGGKGEHGGPGFRLTEAQKAVERRRIGGEGGGGESSGVGRSGLRNGARRSGGGEVGGGDAGAPFYRVGGGAERLGVGGERVVAVVHHNGGGGSHFGRGLTWVVVGSDKGGGCSGRYGSGRGARRRRAHAREAVAATAIIPGRKMNGWGPHVGERGRLAGWAESWNRANSRRKIILFKFLLNFGFGRTLENCTRRF
jgi:hypothetical protein